MLKINYLTAQSQPPHSGDAKTTPQSGNTGAFECNTALPLSDFFFWAVKQNAVYYASKKSAHQYASPLFKLVQCLKSHPALKDCTAGDAFTRPNNEVAPNWGKLFPHVALPSVEFVTAWEQINTPAGMSLWQTIEERVKHEPLTLLAAPTCEGYETYLGIAFHLQRLTPRREILLPVKTVSKLLTALMDKQVSEQSVSHYCRQAKNNGFLKLTAKAHRLSGKAARYRFDLTRFTETGVELDPSSTATHFSHGSQGIHGSVGSKGSLGIEESSSSCVLAHADNEKQTFTKNIQEENIKPNVENIDEGGGIENTLHYSTPQQFETKKKHKKKIRRQSVVALWQAFMFSQNGWQEKLSEEDFTMLVKFGRRTDEFGCLILDWALNNWDLFAGKAVGTEAKFPSAPNIAFFCAYQAVAFNLWLHSHTTAEEWAAIDEAIDRSNTNLDELETFYALGEGALWHNVAAQLKYQELLVKVPKGWEVCGQFFESSTQIMDKYNHDQEFAKLLREAVAGGSQAEFATQWGGNPPVDATEAATNGANKAAQPVKPEEAPIIKLRLTPEQQSFMYDLNTIESFIDKVTEQYGNWKPAKPDDKDAVPCEIAFELAG